MTMNASYYTTAAALVLMTLKHVDLQTNYAPTRSMHDIIEFDATEVKHLERQRQVADTVLETSWGECRRTSTLSFLAYRS